MSVTGEGITTLSDSAFDDLFGDVPEATVNQSHLLGSTKPNDKVEVKNEVSIVENKDIIIPEKTREEIDKELDDILEGTGEDITVDSTTGAITQNTKKSESDNTNIDTSAFFEAQYKGLVERGIWVEIDPESLKDIEWNEETYGNLVELQAQWAIDNKWTDKVSATGDYGKAIFEHIENGGDPKDLISIFREIKEIQNIDTSTTEGKITLLRKYYIDELNWTEAKFKKMSDVLIDGGEDDLNDEITFVNSKIQDSIKDRVEEEKKVALIHKQQQEEAQKNFANNMRTVVTSRTDMNKKEQEEILNKLLNYNQSINLLWIL